MRRAIARDRRRRGVPGQRAVAGPRARKIVLVHTRSRDRALEGEGRSRRRTIILKGIVGLLTRAIVPGLIAFASRQSTVPS